jgi:hypothetical protein
MRESIGTVSLLNFIIFFIFLVFAFLMGTLSYYKAYKVNNAIVSSIEKYEGYNMYARNEINDKLTSLGYQRTNFNCRNVRGAKRLLKIEGSEQLSDNGYCIYVYENDNTYKTKTNKVVKTDTYNSYEVTTIITFQFPIIQDVLKLRVSSRTNRIYDFVTSKNGMN